MKIPLLLMKEVRIRSYGLKKLPAPNLGNVEILLMQLSSCEIAETQLGKILPLWLKSEMDDVDDKKLPAQNWGNIELFLTR